MVMTVAAIASYLLVRVLAGRASQAAPLAGWLRGEHRGSRHPEHFRSAAGLGARRHHRTVLPARICAIPRSRRLAIGWLVAAAAGVVVASPLLVLGWLQRGQIAWLGVNTSSSGLGTLFSLSGSYLVTTTVLDRDRSGARAQHRDQPGGAQRAAWPWRLAELSLPWLIVPPLAAACRLDRAAGLHLALHPHLHPGARPDRRRCHRLLRPDRRSHRPGRRPDRRGDNAARPAHHGRTFRRHPGPRPDRGREARVRATSSCTPTPTPRASGRPTPTASASCRNIALKQGPIPSGTLAGTQRADRADQIQAQARQAGLGGRDQQLRARTRCCSA